MNNVVKYIIRAVKYFFYFSFLLVVFMSILVFAHVVDGNIETMFRGGYNSLIQIAIMFACVSAVYPVFGFVKKSAIIPGEYNEIRDSLISAMEDRGYTLESEDGENLTFRNHSLINRISRMFEDRITFTRELGGYCIEGLRKDTIRIIYALENRFRSSGDE
ncbi:MAG: hypothetical protein ACI3ZT_07940 [Candidatus Cryptobacteroides sp.]